MSLADSFTENWFILSSALLHAKLWAKLSAARGWGLQAPTALHCWQLWNYKCSRLKILVEGSFFWFCIKFSLLLKKFKRFWWIIFLVTGNSKFSSALSKSRRMALLMFLNVCGWLITELPSVCYLFVTYVWTAPCKMRPLSLAHAFRHQCNNKNNWKLTC